MTAQLQFDNPDVSSDDLDLAIDQMVAHCADLTDQVIALRKERDLLMAKNAQALTKVEEVLVRLRALDAATTSDV